MGRAFDAAQWTGGGGERAAAGRAEDGGPLRPRDGTVMGGVGVIPVGGLSHRSERPAGARRGGRGGGGDRGRSEGGQERGVGRCLCIGGLLLDRFAGLYEDAGWGGRGGRGVGRCVCASRACGWLLSLLLIHRLLLLLLLALLCECRVSIAQLALQSPLHRDGGCDDDGRGRGRGRVSAVIAWRGEEGTDARHHPHGRGSDMEDARRCMPVALTTLNTSSSSHTSSTMTLRRRAALAWWRSMKLKRQNRRTNDPNLQPQWG